MRFVADAKSAVFGNLNYVAIRNGTMPPPSSNIVLYTPDLAMHGSWTSVDDSSAASGTKGVTPDNGFATTPEPLAAPDDYVEASFEAPAGTPYAIWLRLRATSDNKFNDSVWVQFSDATAGGSSVYATGSTSGLLVNLEACSDCGVSAWGWQNGAWWLDQATTVTFATNGTHTIRIQAREDGVQIDQIALSPSQFLAQAPGAPKNDSTIVPK